MAISNISYPIYQLSTRTEKGYTTKMIPFFFCSVYVFDPPEFVDKITVEDRGSEYF